MVGQGATQKGLLQIGSNTNFGAGHGRMRCDLRQKGSSKSGATTILEQPCGTKAKRAAAMTILD